MTSDPYGDQSRLDELFRRTESRIVIKLGVWWTLQTAAFIIWAILLR